jgi:polyhydroxybutyrate depolymerase
MIQRVCLFALLSLLTACFGARSTAEAADANLCKTGTQALTLKHDGKQRDYLLYVPTQASASKPVPLVIGLHGGWGTGENFGEQTSFVELAKSEGFALALPDGIWRAWNAGSCCGKPSRDNDDDVGFIAELASTLEGAACIADDQTFGTGFSNGAMLLHRIACERGDVFDAIAPVAGPLMMPRCEKPSPVPALLIRGADDPRIPLLGGEFDGTYRASLKEMADSLLQRNDCHAEDAEPTHHAGADCKRYLSCRSDRTVETCAVTDTGHQWPGGKTFLPRKLGPNPGIFNATNEIWTFFESQER